MKLSADNVILGLLAACAVTITSLVVRREVFARADGPTVANTYVRNASALAMSGYHWGGAPAKHTVLVFSDYQCPFCRNFAVVVDSLHNEFPQALFVERHFPLTGIHQQALGAALAAECARDQGKYAEMRARLFADGADVASGAWTTLAHAAGVSDTSRLAACVRNADHRAVIEADRADARRIGVTGTPGVLIDDTLYAVPPSITEMRRRLSQ